MSIYVSGSNWWEKSRLTVIVGHFGSGKTEIALNLALCLAQHGYSFSLADLDIVDPYFRSRECRELLEAYGGRLIASSQACLNADVPSLPPEVMTLFDDTSRYGVLDIGGDASGARVLARYRRRLQESDACVLCIINANRPLTNTPEKAEKYIRDIETSSGLHINGLINNTHLCNQTTIDDICEGAKLIHEVSTSTGIPVVCHAVPEYLVKSTDSSIYPVFPIKLYMKKPWE